MCACVHTHKQALCVSVHVEVREQLRGGGSIFPFQCVSLGNWTQAIKLVVGACTCWPFLLVSFGFDMDLTIHHRLALNLQSYRISGLQTWAPFPRFSSVNWVSLGRGEREDWQITWFPLSLLWLLLLHSLSLKGRQIHSSLQLSLGEVVPSVRRSKLGGEEEILREKRVRRTTERDLDLQMKKQDPAKTEAPQGFQHCFLFWGWGLSPGPVPLNLPPLLSRSFNFNPNFKKSKKKSRD